MTGSNFPSRDPADSGWGEHGGVNRKEKRGGRIVTNERLCVWACAGMCALVCVWESAGVCIPQLPLSRRGLKCMHLSLLLGKTSIHGYLPNQSGVNVDVGACFIHLYMCVCVSCSVWRFFHVCRYCLFPFGSDLFLVSVILISEPALSLCDCEHTSGIIRWM